MTLFEKARECKGDLAIGIIGGGVLVWALLPLGYPAHAYGLLALVIWAAVFLAVVIIKTLRNQRVDIDKLIEEANEKANK